MSNQREADAERVRNALRHELKIHPRVTDQGIEPSQEVLDQLGAALPRLVAFGEEQFHGVRVVLDWDHQLPSQYSLLRIIACYSQQELERVDAFLEDRTEEIAEINLYPEFDVPDYGDIDGSESYVALLRPGTTEIEDFRFMSNWRKQVRASAADLAVETVKKTPSYTRAPDTRSGDGLG